MRTTLCLPNCPAYASLPQSPTPTTTYFYREEYACGEAWCPYSAKQKAAFNLHRDSRHGGTGKYVVGKRGVNTGLAGKRKRQEGE